MKELIEKYRSAISLISTTMISALLSIILSIILARILSVEERGEFQFIITNILVSATVATGGVGYALGIAIRNKEHQGWQKIYIFYTLYAAIISIILYKITDLNISLFMFSACVVLYSTTLITIEKSNIDTNLTAYKFLNIAQPFLNLILFGTTYLIYRKTKIDVAITYITITYFILFIMSTVFLAKMSKTLEISKKINLYSFKKIWAKQNLFQVFGILTVNLDKYAIAFFLDKYILGIYTVYLALDGLIGRFFQSAANYHYSNIWNNNNKLPLILVTVISTSIIGLLIIYLYGNHAIKHLFGVEYAKINSALPLLTIASILSGISWIISQNMLLIGKQIPLMIRQITSLILFIVSLYLLKDFQLFGIAISLIIASLVRLILSIYYLYRYPAHNYKSV